MCNSEGCDRGGENYAKTVLERHLDHKASSLMEKIIKSIEQSTGFKEVDYKNLLMLIQNEHPQTIALILSYTTAEIAYRLLLNCQTQIEVFQRISNLDKHHQR